MIIISLKRAIRKILAALFYVHKGAERKMSACAEQPPRGERKGTNSLPIQF